MTENTAPAGSQVLGWTFDPAGQVWTAPVPGQARTLLWTTGFDSPPTMTPARVLEVTNANGRPRR
jgi:hypothetical protein